MGLKQEPLWEVQWHPADGGRVRRAVLTRRGVRRVALAAALLVAVLLAILGLLPVGLRGFVLGVRVEQTERENRELVGAGEELRQEARELAQRLEDQLNRARRLAWVLGAPAAVWQPEVPSASSLGADDQAVIGSLEASAARLEEMERALLAEHPTLPCPIASLPTLPPLSLARSVPVDPFGWRVSPFTGKEEAHHGITLAAPAGESVRAPGDGTVVFAGATRERRSNEWTRYGNLVVLAHGGGVFSVFGHLQDVLVRSGQRVTRGATLGTVGTSGWIRVPALYLEIRWPWQGASRPLDPALFQLALALKGIDQRLRSPDGGLPQDYARLEALPGFRG